jgi:hypothetical protein
MKLGIREVGLVGKAGPVEHQSPVGLVGHRVGQTGDELVCGCRGRRTPPDDRIDAYPARVLDACRPQTLPELLPT